MSEEYVLREFDLAQHAEKMAEMMKASDDQWPGTWSGGAEITPQMIVEWHERGGSINRWVFEVGDKIVAYCSLHEMEDQKNAGYVGLLNVQPEYQGRSLGRRLLQKCLERCSELGLQLLSLHTWPGNLKSVPLYKKTGFFWVPDKPVWMLNFVPAILSLPCAQPYFSKHDWYQTFRRELKQAEDKESWEGLKVFTYRWEENGEALTVWADRQARKLTAVETDAFFAGAIADNIEPGKGMSTVMRWQLKNKQDRQMSVSLVASGTEHLQIDHRATVTLAPGETKELEATVDVAADAPDVKRDRPVPAVRTLLIIDGEVLELGTGLQARPPVEVSTSPHHVTLFPGVPKTVHLQLRSRLREDVEATVSLAPAVGLNVDRTEHAISIPSRSFAAIPIELCADDGGVYPLYATVYFEGGKTVPKRLPIFCLPAGGVLAHQGEEETRIENEWTRVVLKNEAGEAFIDNAQDNVGLGHFGERLGPPFWPSELDDKEYDITLQEADGRITALMTADLEAYPELTLCRKVALGGGPLIELEHVLVNNSAQTHRLQVSCGVRHWHNDAATITVPLAGGIVHARRSEFPAVDEDIDKKPEAFAERWAALSSQRGTLGVLWEPLVEENSVGWGVGLLTPELVCEPQQRVRACRTYVYAGPGDWRTVRKHARRLAGTDQVPEPIPVQARPVCDVRIEPAPLVTVDDEVAATVVVDNLRRRPVEGTARLVLPKGLSADRDTFALPGISRETPLNESILLGLVPTAAAYEGSVSLATRLSDTEIHVPVVRLGDRSTVAVTTEATGGQAVYAMDNGRTRFGVAPDFCGALIHWEENGTNHAISPFPERKTFGWMSPWYGGVMPVLFEEGSWGIPGHLDQETLHGQVVDLADARGIPWRGVRVSGDITREELVGLQLELDYLTVGQSNVLKLVCRVHNTTTGKRRVVVGWLTFWQPDGSSEANVLHCEYVERKPTPWYSWSWARHWATVTNAKTGRTAALVSPYPDVCAMDWGDPGGHLGCWSHVDVLPGSTAERVCYLALCDTLEGAKRYAWLKDYLP